MGLHQICTSARHSSAIQKRNYIENKKELFTVFFSLLILSDWKSVTFCIFLSLLCSIIRAVTRNSGRVVFERRGGREEERGGNSNLGFRFSGNFYSQKAAVNDTRAVLKAKQINTLQDEDEIPRAIISGLNSNPYHPLTSSGKVENAA